MAPHTGEEHRSQAEENERFYREHLGGQNTAWPKWALTALFYTAVHEVQAFMVDHGQAPENHQERKAVLRANRFQLGVEMARQYQRLPQSSENPRYELWKPTRDDLKLAENRLERIRAEIKTLRGGKRTLRPG